MEDTTFDAKVQALAARRTRRGIIAVGTGGAIATLASLLLSKSEADAKAKGKRKGKRKGRKGGRSTGTSNTVNTGGGGNNEKFFVCHCQGEGQSINCTTLEVGSQNAVDSHVANHEADYPGECKNEEPDPDPDPEPQTCPGKCKADADCEQPKNPYTDKNTTISCRCEGYVPGDDTVYPEIEEVLGTCKVHEEPKPEICTADSCKADDDCNTKADNCGCVGYVPADYNAYPPVEEVLGICGGAAA